MSRRGAVWIWWLGILLLMATQVPRARLVARAIPALPPTTPLDHVQRNLAEKWKFLVAARPHLEPGATVLCLSGDGNRREEMYLFMFANSVLAGHRVLPNSYFGKPVPGGVSRTTVILSRPCGRRVPPRFRVTWRGEGGCIMVRGRPGP